MQMLDRLTCGLFTLLCKTGSNHSDDMWEEALSDLELDLEGSNAVQTASDFPLREETFGPDAIVNGDYGATVYDSFTFGCMYYPQHDDHITSSRQAS